MTDYNLCYTGNVKKAFPLYQSTRGTSNGSNKIAIAQEQTGNGAMFIQVQRSYLARSQIMRGKKTPSLLILPIIVPL